MSILRRGVITQAEARRLRKEVSRLNELERQRNNAFASEYPGVWIGEDAPEPKTLTAIQTARKLRHAVAVQIHNGKMQFYAVPLEGK